MKVVKDMLYQILGELFIVIVVGMPVSYLLWRLSKTKLTFSEYCNRYAEALGYLCVIMFVVACIIVGSVGM